MTLDLDLDPVPAGLDELAAALVDLPPIGAWVEMAACGPLAGADVWTSDDEPDVDELAVAERVCRRCRSGRSAPATPRARPSTACGAGSGTDRPNDGSEPHDRAVRAGG